MEEETGEMHSEEDKALSDKNKKRKLKTRAQIQALEKFYDEHKYPTESMKFELASSIGLTEKQVSGWFCHRRLKDKRLTTNTENNKTAQKQDLSSGVVVQDSCGSTKQTCDKQLDAREVESGRLTPKHPRYYSFATEAEASSGSNSSLRDRCNNDQNNLNTGCLTASRYPIPRFPFDEGVIKPRTGPSGYLKVKGRVENSAITEVKKQLGKNYRIDGPPLAVEFDILPPHAFESSMRCIDDDETYNNKEAILPISHDAPTLHHTSKFDERHEDKSSDEKSFKTKHRYGAANRFTQRDCNASRNFSIERTKGSVRDIHSSRSRKEYKIRHSPDDVKVARMCSISNHDMQPIGNKMRKSKSIELAYYHKYNGEGAKILHEENAENEYAYNMTMKAKENDGSENKAPMRQLNERRVKMKNDFNAPEMMWEEFTPQQQSKRWSVPHIRQLNRFEPEIPQSCDEEGAETSSSMD